MFKLLAFSAARSDYDRYYPILNGLRKHPKLRLKLIVGSNHFLKKFGNTKSLIDKKFNLLELKKKYSIDSKQNIVANLSKEIIEISKIFSKEKPNALVLFGDRYDMFVGISAIPFNIPIIHLYGGAVTEGAIDEQIRHSITKISHLHLVANENYYKRVVQMGEEKWRVKIIGVPELKYLLEQPIMSINKLSNEMKIDISKPTLLSTFHPETLNIHKTIKNFKVMLNAIKKSNLQVIFTYPNADFKNSKIIKILKNFIKKDKKYKLITNASPTIYSNLLRNCTGMIGNSSSGLVESSIFKIPSLSLGDRQKGKYFDKNVIFVEHDEKKILKNIKFIQSKKFITKIKYMKSGYNKVKKDLNISKFVYKSLSNNKLLKKKFFDFLQ